jgi:hypothetical protein
VTVIIALAVGALALLLGLRNAWREAEPDDFGWTIFRIVASIGGAFIAVLATTGAVGGVANLALDHRDSYDRVPLVALRDDLGVNSGYVLGTGGGEKAHFAFYYANPDGGRQLVTVDAADIRVYEDTDKPYAVRFTGCELSKPWVADCFSNAPTFTELHVPVGTVHNRFDLDLDASGD